MIFQTPACLNGGKMGKRKMNNAGNQTYYTEMGEIEWK
jgi:hypothetical protein